VFQPQGGSRVVNWERDIAALPLRARLRARLSPRRRRVRQEFLELERRQFADPSRVIAVSRQVRDSIASLYGVDAEAITVIPNGVDTAKFDPTLLVPRRAAARAAWGLEGKLVYLLVAGNFHLKGVSTAIQALGRLRARMPNAHLLVAGRGDPAPYLALAAQLGVADRVTFAGRIAAIEDACAAADVALQPTHHDACSLATLEGMACGLPTITTAANGAGELITHGMEGLILPRAGDPAALAVAMAAMDSAGTRARLGAAGRRLAQAQDVVTRYAAIEAFYRQRLRAQAPIGVATDRRPLSRR
jgi:UDP-glucose:(heptosyl)LPS alpha-1,3-glucosyltransferase